MALIGNGNIARKIKGQYIGVNNIARKVTKGYIGVNNVAQLWFSGNVPLELSYTGTMLCEDIGDYRYIALKDTGQLTANRDFSFVYWICGGGGNGGNGYYNSTSSRRAGGGGGGGGYFAAGSGRYTGNALSVEIGAAGGASRISAGGVEMGNANPGTAGSVASTSRGGKGGAGGSGGGGGYGATMGTSGKGGGSATIPFGGSGFTAIPCAGGNGGYGPSSAYGRNGGSNGSDGTTTLGNTSAASGGGAARSSAFYFGGGGGGGGGSSSSLTTAGNGYQGVCFLRIPLSEFAVSPAPVGDISFTLTAFDSGLTLVCHADSGMTWQQWVDSAYNSFGFSIEAYGSTDVVARSVWGTGYWDIVFYESALVPASEVIVAGRSYQLYYM